MIWEPQDDRCYPALVRNVNEHTVAFAYMGKIETHRLADILPRLAAADVRDIFRVSIAI